MIDIRKIVIHCSATKPHQDIGADEIRLWHQDRGWRDIGYHYVIRRDGQVETGRQDHERGAHVKNHNENSLGICLVGGIDIDGNPSANFSFYQYLALKQIKRGFDALYPNAKWYGHYELDSSKACPCFDVNALLGLQ